MDELYCARDGFVHETPQVPVNNPPIRMLKDFSPVGEIRFRYRKNAFSCLKQNQ
jgi:hypothetical protein